MPPVRGFRAFALALFVALGAASARAQEPQLEEPIAEPKTDPLTDLMKRVTDLEGEAKKTKAKQADAAKKPTVNWMMQVQVDSVWSDQDAANRRVVGGIPDGTVFRRARVGMYGDYAPFEYRIAMDFALPGRPSFIDVFLAVNDVPYLGRVRVGHFFEPFSLEQYSQNRFVTFMERALSTEPIAPGRNLGVMANDTFANERATWALGAFRTDSDVFGDETGNDFSTSVTGRVTALPWYEETSAGADLLHVGAAYSARATKGGQVRFVQRPEIRLGSATPNVPNFVDTGPIGAGFYQLLGAELLWIRGPLSVQGEYVLVPVDTYRSGAVYFQSWYVMGSAFLTGESRQYRKSTGTLERISPRRDFIARDGCGGWALGPGAWEVAARLSHLDLNNGGVSGGRLTDFTVGVNWYLNPYLRMTANYIRAYQIPRTNGAHGTADFYALRANFDF